LGSAYQPIKQQKIFKGEGGQKKRLFMKRIEMFVIFSSLFADWYEAAVTKSLMVVIPTPSGAFTAPGTPRPLPMDLRLVVF